MPGSGFVTNEELVVDLATGDELMLHLYYTTDGPSQSELRFGGGVEITTSQPGKIRFEAAESFDFDVVLQDMTVVDKRWGNDTGEGFVGPGVVSDDFIDQMDFFTLFASGLIEMNTGPVFFDTGYDASADAFFIGSIELTALEDGSVDLATVVGDPISMTNDGFTPYFPEFGGVAINVFEISLVGGELSIVGTDNNDNITAIGTATAGQVAVTVNGRATEIFDGVDRVIIDGKSGNDVIEVDFDAGVLFNEVVGGPGADMIMGGVGKDILNGNNGPDCLFGFENDDELFGGGGNDELLGGGEDDFCSGGVGNDCILGENGFDNLQGGEDDDIIIGGNGDDVISGFGGRDQLFGNAGMDQIFGGQQRDTIIGGSGMDFLSGQGGNDVVRGGTENDDVQGGAGIDRLFGDDGDDILSGNGGNDFFPGGNGLDEFFGGAGNDTGLDTGENGESSIEN